MKNDLSTAQKHDREFGLAQMIASQMDGWTAERRYVDLDRNYQSIEMVGPNGHKIDVSLDWRDHERVEFHGVMPKGYTYDDLHGVDNPKITASIARTPSALAKDIARRLMPGYLAAFAKVQKRMQERLDDDANQAATLEAIVTAHPSLGPVYQKDRLSEDGLSVRINHDGRGGSLELRYVPIELIHAVLDAIYKEGGPRG